MNHSQSQERGSIRPPPSLLPEIGALRQWWAELECGLRTKHTHDPVLLAACAEANARDALRFGSPEIASSYRRQAAEIILEAAKRCAI